MAYTVVTLADLKASMAQRWDGSVFWTAEEARLAIIDALHVDGVAATPTLVEDGDFVDLGQELQDTLLDYAVHVTAFKEGGPRWALTLPYATAFLRAAAEENGQLKANQRFRRYAGLDRRRDLQPTHKAPTQLDQIVQAVGSSQADSGAG